MSPEANGLPLGNRRALLDALWRYDPAGVSEDRLLTPHEYDGLAAAVAHLLVRGKGDADLLAWLQDELGRNWGLQPLPHPLALAVQEMRVSWFTPQSHDDSVR